MVLNSICGIPGYWSVNLKKSAFIWFVVSLVYFLVCSVFSKGFALDNLSGWASRTLFYQWMAPCYASAEQRGKLHKFCSNNGFSNDRSPNALSSDDISVVILREADLQKQQTSWPVSYEFHADVLDSILERGPESIFIDIGFIDRFRSTDGLDDLVDVLRRADKRGIKIFLAAPSSDSNASVISQLLEYGEEVSVLIDSTRISNRYYLVDKNDRKSAALAMYDSTMPPPEMRIDPDNVADIPMHIAWGQYSGIKNNGSYQCDEDLLSSSPNDRIWNTITQNTPPKANNFFENKFNDGIRQICPPHQTIAVDYLLNGDDNKWLNKNIKDHYVFYGVDLEMVDGSVLPPTNTKLPGVFLHAMAFDNLLQFNSQYIIKDRSLCDAEKWWVCSISISFVPKLGIWVLITLLTTLEVWLIAGSFRTKVNRPENRVEQRYRNWKLILWAIFIDILFTLFAVFIIWYITLYLYYDRRIVPIDFLAMFSLVTAGMCGRNLWRSSVNLFRQVLAYVYYKYFSHQQEGNA